MIVEPKIRGFICTTAHPIGCDRHVAEQIEYVRSKPIFQGPKRVLVIGSSTGYGLASRIAAAFGCHASTVGVALERPASGGRTATAGWYNTAAFEKYALEAGLYARSIMGDAFSQEIKQKAAALIGRDLGTVDMVVYSLAAPRRTAPDGVTYHSALKPLGSDFVSKTIDLSTRTVSTVTVPAATQEELLGTVKVMGGEDWMLWMRALDKAGVLAKDAVTVAFSYIGPRLTHAIYREGTVGRAKLDLEATAKAITQEFSGSGVKAYVSVNKALVTQASSAIPVVPLYISILYKIMKRQGTHEDCIRQMDRLFREKLPLPELDEAGRLRMDDREMDPLVQRLVAEAWEKIGAENLNELADIDGYWQDFYRLFGFGMDGVDYGADVDTHVDIPGLVE